VALVVASPSSIKLAGRPGGRILDVGAWDNSVMVNSPGESGVPGSAHYSDLMPLWDQGQYIPMLYSRAAVEQHVSERVILEPAK